MLPRTRFLHVISQEVHSDMAIDTYTPRATAEDWEFGKLRASAAIEALQPPQPSVNPDDPRETPSPTLGQQMMAKAPIKFLSAIISDANDLLVNGYEDEDGDHVHTAQAAHNLCFNILVDAAIDDSGHRRSAGEFISIPKAIVSPDGCGGLRVEWVRSNANVHLVVPSDVSKAYVFTQFGSECKMHAATGNELAACLRHIN